MRKYSSKIHSKVLAILGISLLAPLYISIGNMSSAKGYELSIYKSTPISIWILIILILFFSTLIIYFRSDIKLIFLSGLLTIISYISLLLLPMFRGYYLPKSGDLISHLGTIQIIISTGHMPESNFYPIIHILGAIMSQIFGLDSKIIIYILIAAMYILYYVGPALLMYSISGRRGASMSLVFFTPLLHSIFQGTIGPAFVSFYIFPILLYLYRESGEKISPRARWAALSVPLLLFITFGHPLSGAIIAILSVIPIVVYISTIKGESYIDSLRYSDKFRLFSSSIIGISWFVWYFSFSSIQFKLRLVSSRILGASEGGATISKSYGSVLATSDIGILYIVRLFVIRYGMLFIYYIVLIVVVYIIYKYGFYKSEVIKETLIELAFSVGLAAIFIFTPLIVGSPIRVNRWSTFFMVVLISVVISNFMPNIIGDTKSHIKINRLWKNLLIILVIISLLLSLASVYPAPINGRANAQVTNQDMEGSQWIMDYKVESPHIAFSHAAIRRFAPYLDEPLVNDIITPIPDRFGYTNGQAPSSVLRENRSYILLTKRDLVFPETFPERVRTSANQYTDESIDSLNNDANKLYSNGEYWIYQI